MTEDVKLEPGWLWRDVQRAAERAKQWEEEAKQRDEFRRAAQLRPMRHGG